MLVLTRRARQAVVMTCECCKGEIRVTVDRTAKVAIEAPSTVTIRREEHDESRDGSPQTKQ